MTYIYKWKHEILLLLIVLIGAALRIHHLTNQSLWLDEVFTMHIAQLSFTQIWNFTISSIDVHPPLFYFFERIGILIFGLTSFGLRIFPAIFGIITIPIFYFIGKELTNNKSIGLLMAMLLTISTFHIYHSQDARMYSLYLLLFSFGLYFFIRAYQTGKMLHIILACVSLALCVYTHFTGIYIGAFFLMVSIILKNKKFVYGMVLYILIILPLLPTIISVMFLAPSNPFYIESGRASAFVGIDAISRTITYMLGSSSFSLVFFFISIIGIIHLINQKRKIGYMIIAFCMTTFAIIGATSYKLPIEPRHFIYLLPILIMSMAFGIEYVYQTIHERYYKIPQHIISLILLLCILLINIPMLSFYYTENTKADYRGLSEKISNITNTNDIVVLVPGGTQKVFELYYNSTAEKTTVYYVNNKEDINKIYNEHYISQKTSHSYECNCNKNPIEQSVKMIVIVTSDIKYDANSDYYNEFLSEHSAKLIEKYDTFSIYTIG